MSQARIDTDKYEEMPPKILPTTKDELDKSSPDKAQSSKKSPAKKMSKSKDTPLSKEDSPEKMEDAEPCLSTDIQSEDELISSGPSSQIIPSASEPQSTPDVTESIVSEAESQPAKTKKDEKMTMEEKIAAQKAKKNIKEEEPVFAGMKLKKSKQLQRQWTEPELETVKLKDHQFEQIAQIETVTLF